MKLKSIAKAIIYRICRNRFYTNILPPPSARVVFQDGSTRDDIQVGKNFQVFGILHSQSHGKIKVGDWVTIGRNVQIRSCKSISIGSHTVIAANVIIQDNNTHPISPRFRKVWSQMPESSDIHLWKWSDSAPVSIGENVWIGENARICKGVSIGNNCVVNSGTEIRPSDGYTIYSTENNDVLNNGESIVIGNHVLIEKNVSVGKGTVISDNTVVMAGSSVNRKFSEKNICISGVPAETFMKNINWDRRCPNKFKG